MRTACLGWFLSVAALAAQTQVAPRWSDALAAAAAARCEAWRAEHEPPGMSVAIGVGGEIVFARGFGRADLEQDVAATADTVYRLGSISKPVTAVAALQLAEQGQLDLDADVRTWLPEWPQRDLPVTVRQLLGHLGGVRHYRRGENESTERFPNQRAGLVRFAADPLLHEPGTKYLYSTYGYNLVAAAVEAVAGKPFPAVVREAVAGPSGAPTLQDDDLRRLVPHRAAGYVRGEAGLENSELMDGSYKLGGGGLCASAPDLARFGLALLDGRLLRAESLQAMTTPQQTKGGEWTGYGLGLNVAERGGRREFAHGGAQARVSTALCMCPEPRVVVAVLCNLERLRPMALARELLDLAAAGPK